MSTLLWFRQDLRLEDQPALDAAVQEGPVVPVYVLDDEAPGAWRIGGAQRWWLHHSLTSLAASLEAKGSRLILRRGSAAAMLRALLAETGATHIHALAHDEPWWREAEAELGDRLTLHPGHHLAPLDEVRTRAGQQFRVYGAFWKALATRMPPGPPEAAPQTIAPPATWPRSDSLADWGLLPTRPDWSTGFDWHPGEPAARAKLTGLADKIADYAVERNLPAHDGSTRLSPHLHFGEVSPRAVWHAAAAQSGATKFHQELAWRDFTAGVVRELPCHADEEGRAKMKRLAWRTGRAARDDLRAWQQGRTGYPIIDAGMRQLWTTGWMHNRVRMIAASFLVKHLLIDWREGERWFWDTLVDADYGNNAVNWQWVAGTGVDANMFSRIMAPLVQSVNFDAGDYIRRWVPELAGVPDPAIHDPEEAGCLPGGYPRKIIGHREARARALAALATV